MSRHDNQLFVILHNIRSAHNVGAIFRTADGAGVSKVYLCGYTPSPRLRSTGAPSPRLRSTGAPSPRLRSTGTPSPRLRSASTPLAANKAQREIEKTALGAEKYIPWEHHKQTVRLVKKLQKQGVRVVALEQTPKSIPYMTYKPKFPLCLIVGNEVEGIPASLLKLADDIIEIPMRGKKESLNVSVAFGIAVYHISLAK